MNGSRPASARRPATSGLPPAALVLAALAAAFFVLPIAGLVHRAPWSDLWEHLSAPGTVQALRLSLVTSVISALVCVVFGVPLAWVLARSNLPGRSAVRALCTMSMVLPPVVGGIALFFALGRRGLVGQLLDDWFGLRLPFTTAAVVIAQTFVAMPFLVVTVDAALRQLDGRAEEAANTLGASPWHAFRRVTLPSIRPALVAGTVLAWARALGEFGATITFAGNLPGTTQTLPLAVYAALESDPDRALVLSLVLVAVSFTVLVGLRGQWLGAAARSAPGRHPGGARR